eukprot:g6697.t1
MDEALSVFLKGTTIVQEIPIIGQVAKLFKTVYETYQQTGSNIEEAKEATIRCQYLANIIIQCLSTYDKTKQPLKETQMNGLEVMYNHTEKMVKLIQSYCAKGTVSKTISADTFKSQYDEINKHIDEAMQMVQLGVTTTILQQNNDLLAILSSSNKNKLDANNTDALKEWIGQYGTISSSSIVLKEIVSEEGANGVVHRGIKDEYLEVAVKIISVEKSFTWENSKNDVFRETFVGMMFPHPNIVRTLGCVYDQKPSANSNGKLMVIMEYMKNGSLHSFIKSKHKTLTKPDRHVLISNAANGIFAMHQKHICHHDIKPGNMLLDDRFNVKICDLDTVKDLSAATSKTTKSVVGGHTTQYTAPEYLRGGNAYTTACDVFSFAMTMYEVATGTVPFEGKTHIQIATELVTNDTRPQIPDNMYDLVDAKYINIMRNAWRSSPDERPSMREIAKSLHELSKSSGTSTLQIPVAPQSRNSSSEDVEREHNKFLEEQKRRLQEHNALLKNEAKMSEMEKELARVKLEAEKEKRRLKKEFEDNLKASSIDLARQQHENDLNEIRLREKKEQERSKRIQDMKQMPVIQRAKSFLNEISKLPSLSEALSKFTQCEEYERNVKSLKQRYADATENLTRHVSNEKERHANLKKRWNLELEEANQELAKAKEATNISAIKSVRKLIKEIKEKLESTNSTVNDGAGADNIKTELEKKESLLNAILAIGNSEIQLYKERMQLEHDINEEIQKAAMLEEDEYDEKRLDALDKYRQDITKSLEVLKPRPFVKRHIEEEEKKEIEEQKITDLILWMEKQLYAQKPQTIKEVLKKYGIKKSFFSSKRRYALHNACIANDFHAIMTLIAHSYEIDINDVDKDGNTALQAMLIHGGDFVNAFKLIHLFNTNKIDLNLMLMVAKEFKRTNTVEYIEMVSNNINFGKKRDLIHVKSERIALAVRRLKDTNWLKDITKLASQRSKEIKKEFPDGTPLVCACEKGRVEDVKLLIAGHDVNGSNGNNNNMTLKEYVNQEGKNSYGDERTPLMAAAEEEYFQIIIDLIRSKGGKRKYEL